MQDKIIDGKKIAAEIRAELKQKAEALRASGAATPGLALLLVGDDPASLAYVTSKDKACRELGYRSLIERMDGSVSEERVISKINEWNADPSIHGILVQLPLPKQVDENKVVLSISPAKDVDGFHPYSMGGLVIGLDSFMPCTPAGIFEMLKRSGIDASGRHVVVLGRSNIVGKPIANIMLQKRPFANATVTVCHTGTPDFAVYTRQADILIVAAGRAEIIKKEHVKEGVVVVDVGINRVEADNEKGYRLTGDVDFGDVLEKASRITPVPGGVGPMTIAMLMYNTYLSAAKAAAK